MKERSEEKGDLKVPSTSDGSKQDTLQISLQLKLSCASLLYVS